MARALLESSGGAAAAAAWGFLPPWLAALGMVVASVWVVSFAVFLCGRSSSHDDVDVPKRKPPAAATAPKVSRQASVAPTKVRSSRSGSSAVGTTGWHGAAYASGGCHGHGHGHGGGGGCGGGGGGGCGGGGGGGC
ncbi:hypothetical protein ACQJBY_044443 [Aegilops geniculata]